MRGGGVVPAVTVAIATADRYDGVRRWTSRRQADLFSMELLLVPVNIHNTHWTLVGCDLKAKVITYYDSMSGNGSQCVGACVCAFVCVRACVMPLPPRAASVL